MRGVEDEDAGDAAREGRSTGWLLIGPAQRGHVVKSTPVNARCFSRHVCCGELAGAGVPLTSRQRRASASFVWTLLLASRP